MDNIGDMLDNQVPTRQMVSNIEQYGLSEKPTEDDLKEMKEDGAPDEVLAALRAATVHPEAGTRAQSNYQKAATQTVGDPDKAFSEAEGVSEGLYGIPVITHCCLETHGSISEWTDADHVFTHISTQNVSGIAGQMAEPLKIPATNIRVHQDNVGGGFGSKFCPDRWGVFTAQISKKADGKPVRYMLERDAELKARGSQTVGVCARESSREKRRHADRVAIQLLGNRRAGRRGNAADSLCLQHSEPAPGAYGHPQQHRPGAGLARSESSASRGAHHVRAGRSRRQAQHGSG